MVLATRRLILRPWRLADAEAFYSYAKDPALGPMAGWPPHRSAAQSRDFIRIVLLRPESYAVVQAGSGLLVGSASIRFGGEGGAPLCEGEAELGYWIGAPHWNRGFATEAVEALLRRCFGALGCPAVWCGYYEGNARSRRVQEKCGFVYQCTEEAVLCRLLGETRVEHFSRITREEWEKRLPQRR